MDKLTFTNLLDLTMVSLNFNVVSTSFDNQNEKKAVFNSSEQNMPQIISKGIKLVSKVNMKIDSTFFFEWQWTKKKGKHRN